MTLEFSRDQATAEVKSNGFYVIKDSEMGKRVDEMIQSDSFFKLSDERGFEFWRDNIKSDQRIQDLLRALEKDENMEYLLGDSGWLQQDPTHVLNLRHGGQRPDIVTIQVWPNNSKAIYYLRSHTVKLPRYQMPTRMWEVEQQRLTRLGCEGKPVDFDLGGKVFFDTRIALDMISGRSYYYTYFDKKLLKSREPLVPPPSRDVKELARLGVYVDKSQLDDPRIKQSFDVSS